MAEKVKKVGRPKNVSVEDTEVNETETERLDMSQKQEDLVEQLTKEWRSVFQKMTLASSPKVEGVNTVVDKWDKLNPFLQNQRIKNIYTQAKKYGKANISEFLSNPGSSESQLRSLGWANSSSQQIYYNILRRSADIPKYCYYKIPDLLEGKQTYKDEDFKVEDRLTDEWLETFNIPNTFKTIALEVKREGKSSYILRNKIIGEGKQRKVDWCTLQKLPTEWVKITGRGELGFTVSFNFMYFMNIANSPSFFGEYFEQAWNDMITGGVVTESTVEGVKKYELNKDLAKNYKFTYNGKEYSSTLEYIKGKRQAEEYFFWVKLPFDFCFTFGSDNSNPWVAPDTMGLMLKLQELTDYGTLAGLIASTPLTSVLTGEIEPIPNPRAGKDESVFNPETIRGMMDQFNLATSTNIECWLFPAKNIKLQQLNSDINSSDIINTATDNFITSSGDAGLTVTTNKPNVAQVNVAKQLAASQQEYVTLQFENVINFILQHKIGLEYRWKIRIWDDIFNHLDNVKLLKEQVTSGNIALLPKLMSAERMSMIDTKAVAEYIKTLDFYKYFMMYTQQSKHEMDLETQEQQEEREQKAEESGAEVKVGRPNADENSVENDATAAGIENGTNTKEGRESA